MKKVPLAQWIFFVIAVLYILESIFLAGLFTNILICMATLVVGFIVIVVSVIKKQWKWVFLDLVICLVCSGIAVYLHSL